MLLSSLEALLNRSLADSSSAQALCRRLEGRTLAIHVTGTPVSLCFRSTGEQLVLSATPGLAADATITGTPLALAGLVARRPESQVRTGAVRIEGDAEVAQSFQQLLKASRPDAEEELSRLVGDAAAYQVGSLARGVFRFGQRAIDTFGQNLAEYLQEESRDVPTRLELDEFATDVDRLRDAVERVAARIDIAERQT